MRRDEKRRVEPQIARISRILEVVEGEGFTFGNLATGPVLWLKQGRHRVL